MNYNAEQGCREHLGCHPCDQRRQLSYLQRQFPGVDFSLVRRQALQTYIPATITSLAVPASCCDATSEAIAPTKGWSLCPAVASGPSIASAA